MRPGRALSQFSFGVFALSAILLVVHGLSSRGLFDPLFAPGSMIAGLAYIPALPLTAVCTLSMLISDRARQHRMGALLLACAHYLMCGDYAPARIIDRMGAEAFASGRSLRIGAANVQYMHQGPEFVGKSLRKIGADIWLLSEFEIDAKQEDLFLSAMPNHELIIGESRDVAVLTRQPVIAWQEVGLPSRQTSLRFRNTLDEQENNPRRSFLHVTVDTENGPVHVLPLRFIAGRPPSDDPSVQLRWGRYLLREQIREVEAFAAYVSQLSGPIVFGGDLNATHASPVLRKLRAMARDVYLETNTFGDYTFRTFTPWLPPIATLRLDYLFANVQVEIRDSWRDLVKISDHFPIIGEFIIGSH